MFAGNFFKVCSAELCVLMWHVGVCKHLGVVSKCWVSPVRASLLGASVTQTGTGGSEEPGPAPQGLLRGACSHTAADRHCGHNRLELCVWERDSVTISVLCCNQVRLAYQSPGKPALGLVTACLMGMGISLSLLRLSWCFFLFQQRQT